MRIQPAYRPELALALPLAFTLVLIALGLLPSIRRNPNLVWSFWGAGAVLLAWNAVTLTTARRRGRRLAVEVVLRKQHYLQACAHLSILLYWGWYWRAGVRLGAADRGAAGLRVRVRRAAHLVPARHLPPRVRTVPDHLQHESLPVVQAGLVLPAIRDGRGGLRGQGADPVEQGGAADAHLQPLVVHADAVLADPAPDCARPASRGVRRSRPRSINPPHIFL